MSKVLLVTIEILAKIKYSHYSYVLLYLPKLLHKDDSKNACYAFTRGNFFPFFIFEMTIEKLALLMYPYSVGIRSSNKW